MDAPHGSKDRQRFKKRKNGFKKDKIANKKWKSVNKAPDKNERQNASKNKTPKKIFKKYKRGEPVRTLGIKTRFKKTEFVKKEKKIEYAQEQSARSELLLTEDKGFITYDEEDSYVKQKDLIKQVDITTATKHFNLHLNDFGPYTLDYTRNGRYLLIGGKRGHLAAMDWMTKRLKCEINVMEQIEEVCWLHQETMYAVAQKNWTYIYDNQGVELHCIKALDNVLRMEFLPYHFLLVASSEKSFLSWLDISVGKMIAQFPTRKGRLDVMCQNPYNATVVLGHPRGVVTMWSPNTQEPLMSMLCHTMPLRGVAVDSTGKYLATSSVDRGLKIWDLRNTYRCLKSYCLSRGSSNLVFSQTGLLATSIGNMVEVYKDCCIKEVSTPIMRHYENETIRRIKFCPYEDVLGIGHDRGFTSIIIPGAGEPNFDALESNPFQTKSQRREAEVKALLGKIPADLICLDPTVINRMDLDTLMKKADEKHNIKYVKPQRIWNRSKLIKS